MAPARDPSRRRRILDVAREHFRQYGFVRARLDDIAAGAGCSKGALYLEFANKETLMRCVADELFGAIRTRYEDEVLTIASPLARIGATLRLMFDLMLSEPLFQRLLSDDPELRMLRDQPEVEAAAANAEFARIQAWIDECIELGEIRPDVDRDAMPHVLALLKFAPHHLRLATLGRFDERRTLDALADNFVAGLAARPPARTRRKGSDRD